MFSELWRRDIISLADAMDANQNPSLITDLILDAKLPIYFQIKDPDWPNPITYDAVPMPQNENDLLKYEETLGSKALETREMILLEPNRRIVRYLYENVRPDIFRYVRDIQVNRFIVMHLLHSATTQPEPPQNARSTCTPPEARSDYKANVAAIIKAIETHFGLDFQDRNLPGILAHMTGLSTETIRSILRPKKR